MSVAQSAARLRAAGEEAENNIRGAVAQTAQGIQEISQQLQMARTSAEDSTNVAASVLDESHPATGEIVGMAAHVVEEVERVRGLLSQLELELDSVGNAGSRLRETFEGIANRLMGGGA